MASHFSLLKKEHTLGSMNYGKVSDLDETDPFYFVVTEAGKKLAEGDITEIKMQLPLEYFDKKITRLRRDRTNMLAFIEY